MNWEIARLVSHLEGGGVLAYPTETVYGLGAAATEDGVRRIRALKGRDDAAPFLVLLPADRSPETAPERWGLTLPDSAREAASALWPGPLTMVLFDRDARFPSGIRSTDGGVAVRVSPHPFVVSLMKRWNRPLISTSANRTGSAPAGSADEIERSFAGLPGVARLRVVDAGPLAGASPSSLVDFTREPPRMIREGALSFARLSGLIPNLVR